MQRLALVEEAAATEFVFLVNLQLRQQARRALQMQNLCTDRQLLPTQILSSLKEGTKSKYLVVASSLSGIT